MNNRGRGRGGARHFNQRSNADNQETQKKEAILDLKKYENQRIQVKFGGNREVEGELVGWDSLSNIILNDSVETFYDCSDESQPPILMSRKLGLTVCRGPQIMFLCPMDGCEKIENPFAQTDE